MGAVDTISAISIQIITTPRTPATVMTSRCLVNYPAILPATTSSKGKVVLGSETGKKFSPASGARRGR